MDSRPSKPGPAAGAARSTRPRRRRRRGPPKPAAPAAILARDAKPLETTKPADEPLSAEEAAIMRQHFRFLREFRRDLRLRLNAAEDLLLNGAREPTHRGVCQHLLAKVERARVLWAAKHLPPQDARRLMEGILGIFPDLEYVLLYLECVQGAAPTAEATAALVRGLERIDFSQVSAAQMRRVLDLVVELYAPQQLPQLLLGLLEGKTFRRAFDDSADTLPGPLAELVVPLRAAHATVFRGKRAGHDRELVERGVNLLLAGGAQALLRRPAEVRHRLLEAGLAACAAAEHRSHAALELLLGSFAPEGPEYPELAALLIRHLLDAGAEADARRVLRSWAAAQPGAELPQRWLEALDVPRLGPVALLGPGRQGRDESGRRRRRAGAWIHNLRPVWVFVSSPDQAAEARATVELLGSLAVPGVVSLLHSGQTERGEPYYVVAHPGHNLEPALDRRGGLDLETALQVCRDAVSILAALARAQVLLPDARSRRFDLTSTGRVWLVDLTGAEPSPGPSAERHDALARDLCSWVLSKARRYRPPQPLRELLATSATAPELVGLLERLQGG